MIAVIVIAFKDFQDEEYLFTRMELEKAGFRIKVASSSLGAAIGKFGNEVLVDMLFFDINVSDFDAIVVIGGPGAMKYFDNSDLHKAIKEAVKKGKVLAAICIAPVILAKAGVLNAKKATVWSSDFDKSAIKMLKNKGTIYQDEPVVIDGNIITANGPKAARDFGKAIAAIAKP